MGGTVCSDPGSYASRKSLIAKEFSGETIRKHIVVGSTHYVSTEKGAYVVLTSKKNLDFFWKTIHESCHPFYYKVTASFLHSLPHTDNSEATTWRENCWAWVNRYRPSPGEYLTMEIDGEEVRHFCYRHGKYIAFHNLKTGERYRASTEQLFRMKAKKEI